MPRPIHFVPILTLVGLFCSPISAFERDSHYYLRFVLSLATCFDWEESRLIASSDWGLDENRSTHAEMNPVQRRNKIRWHAFGHSDERFHELWQRSRDEPDLRYRLIKLGQFMHFLEDWESHAGYGVRLGHARATFGGRDPDSLGSSAVKNRRMVQSALDHLLETCADLGRLDADTDRSLARLMKAIDDDGLLEDLFEASDPKWKKGKAGGFRKRAGEILAVNKERVEQVIARYLQPIDRKGVPADFLPGDHGRGLPPSLGLTFDPDGNMLDVPETVEEIIAAHDEARDLAPDLAVRLTKARARKNGWRVRIEVANEGDAEVSGASVEIVAIDADEENVLAKLSEELPALGPGETVTLKLLLPSVDPAPDDGILGAWVRARGDDDAMDDVDWLMSDEVANEAPSVSIIDDVDDTGAAETVRLLAPPRLIAFDDQGCLILTALADEGDTPEKLGEARFGLISSDGSVRQILRRVPAWWSATSTTHERVAGKLISCFRPGPEQCDVWWSLADPYFFLEIESLDSDVEAVFETLPIETEVRRAVLDVCHPFGTSG